MRLHHIRAAASVVLGEKEQQRAIATAARKCLADATTRLVGPTKRPLPNADNPLAARYLLAIEDHTGKWSLQKRYKRAAEALRFKEVASMLQTRDDKPKNYVQRLMEELADNLLDIESDHRHHEQETSFERSFVDEFLPSWMQPPLPDYRRAWFVTHHLPRQCEVALECVGRKSPEQHKKPGCGLCVIPLAGYARLAAITKEIDEPDNWEMFSKERFPARSELRRIQAASLFDTKHLTQAKLSVVNATSVAGFAKTLNDSVLRQWDTLLRACKCHPKHPNPACRVHQVILASIDYAKTIAVEWQRLQEQLHASHPADFTHQTVQQVYGRVGLRVPGS
jgi:hypothetical protein